MAKIENISQKTENAILRKSAYSLPNRPSESGIRAEDVKKSFHGLITDKNDSVLSELKRIVNEANDIIKNLEDEINKKEPEISSSNLISADFIDDTNSKNKFLTDEERKLLYKFNKETWVINENPTLPTESKSYTINANVNLYDGTEIISITADYWQFYNNAALFFGKTRYTTDGDSVYYNSYLSAYYSDSNTNQNEWSSHYDTNTSFIIDSDISKKLRTITFNEEPDEEILAWLQANAVLQPNIQQIIPNNGEEATEELKTLQIGDINFLLSKGDFFFNLAYGDTAPEDTTKLWVKCQEPSNINIMADKDVDYENATLSTLDTKLTHWTEYNGAASVGTDCYSFSGGHYYIQKYDTVLDTCTVMNTTLRQDVLDSTYWVTATAVETDCYIFGGEYGRYVEIYNTLTDTLTFITTPGEYVMELGAGICSVDDDIYIFGGNAGGSAWNYIRKYDTTTSTFSNIATLNIPAAYTSASSVGTDCYVFGGWYIQGSGKFNTIQKYDTVTRTVTNVASLNNKTGASCSIGTNCYIFNNPYIQKYDTIENTVTTLSASVEHGTNNGDSGYPNFAACSAGGDAYILGGGNCIQKLQISIPLEANLLMLINAFKKELPIFKYKDNYLNLYLRSIYIGNSENEAEQVEVYQYNNDTQQWEKVI